MKGESVYTQASKELSEVREDAGKGFNTLRDSVVEQTRHVTIHDFLEVSRPQEGTEGESSGTKDKQPATEETEKTEESMFDRLRAEAAKRLKDLQRAEDAADEALLRFGGNVRDFLKDAISVQPANESGQGAVLFESKDAKGKRVIHTSRFDAQLHVIHTSTESFSKDPPGPEYEQWSKDFDIEKKTDDIANDLAKYPDLRATMEKLVPDQIPYADFWKRYYFLRHGIETAEARRRDLLKGMCTSCLTLSIANDHLAAEEEDEVGWGDDSDDEESTPAKKPASVTSSTTIQPPAQKAPEKSSLKPNESRKSNDEKSQADSDTSYDVVGAASGKTSQAPNSPKDAKKADDSDDDWE